MIEAGAPPRRARADRRRQAVSHMSVDVQSLDCDFYVFSGHKVFAPTGIGVVYGKTELLDNMPPWQGGGNMIDEVTFEKTTYQTAPATIRGRDGQHGRRGRARRRASTMSNGWAWKTSPATSTSCSGTASSCLQRIPGLHMIGTAKEKAGVLSFVMEGVRTEDLGRVSEPQGIAVRAGHHCAQPIHRRFGLESTLRASLALYNTCEEVDALVAALWDLRQGRNPGLV